ncbi:MAG: T9SS type A sorting domain-containing protein [Flavobacteriales bacterium]|nr:T9SS type A sorting domain-containing protein [Flavobacteriales bacterium]
MRCSRYWTILFAQAVLPLLLLLAFTCSKAQVIHNRAFGTSSGDAANDIIITHDNNYMMLGRHYKNLYLAKADTIGQLIWEKSYPADSILLYPSSICEIGDTSFVVAGNYQNEGFLLKVNAFGDTLFHLMDSAILGENVSNLRQAPDGNLLALVTHYGIVSLLKFDNNLNVIARIDSLTPPSLRGIEIIGNKIYMVKINGIDNLLIIDNNLTDVDTVNIPLNILSYLRISLDSTQLIFEGTDTGVRKLLYTDLLGNINSVCDTAFLLSKTDFKPVDNSSNWIYANYYYDSTWGQDIRLYFTDNCGQILHDTILYRRGSFGDPWRDEDVIKLLVDQNGNYIIFGQGEKGPLGDWDIFLWIYKQWDGFPTNVEELDKNKILSENTISVYPNPFNVGFTLAGLVEKSEIYIVDISGKLVHQSLSTSTSTTINTTNLAKGLYIVQVKGSQHVTTLKVVKQ